MKRVILLILLVGFFKAGAQQLYTGSNRKPVFAGSFYPANPAALRNALADYFEKAGDPFPDHKMDIRAIIVPHAGYPYSGEVAAAGFSTISPGKQYDNIFILASSHRLSFNGASVYSEGDYESPLGAIEVNKEIARKLINDNKNIEFIREAHENEHSIEVQLPWIQYYFKNPVKIVPIVIGSQQASASKDLAIALLPYFNKRNLFIISSDFSHYPAYRDAVHSDKSTCEAILTNSPETFYNSLRESNRSGVKNLATPACGWTSILTLLYMTNLDEQIKFEPVLYRNSGDATIGDKDRVVGYWAIAAFSENRDEDAGYLSENEKVSLLRISRTTLEEYINHGNFPEIDARDLTPALKKPSGAFVSLYINDKLRGCIGQFAPTKPLYMVIQEMTAAAAVNDRRFVPVQASELRFINLEISVLTPLRKITDISEFELGKHGIYIMKDGHAGTYLPQVAETKEWTAEEFISQCSKEKAGLGWDGWKNADLYVYEAIVFGEGENK